MKTETREPPKQGGLSFSSLGDLKSYHSILLQRQQTRASDRPNIGEIHTFLQAASRAGASLEDIDSRETAQGILDFWAGVSATVATDPNTRIQPVVLGRFDDEAAKGLSDEARLRLTQARDAAANGDALIASSSPSQARAIKRVLARMLRLKEGSLEPYATPVALDDEIFDSSEAKTALLGLEQAGVLRRNPSDGNDGFSLAHEMLLTDCQFLSNLVTQRKALREMARGWDRGGRRREGLLAAGPQLDATYTFRGLNDIEQEFVEESRRRAARIRNVFLGAALSILGILLVLSVALWFANKNLQRSNSNLKETNKKLIIQKAAAEKAQKKTEAEKKNAEMARRLASEARNEAEAARDEALENWQAAERNLALKKKADEEKEQSQNALVKVDNLLAQKRPKEAKRVAGAQVERTARAGSEAQDTVAEIFYRQGSFEREATARKYMEVLQKKGVEFPVRTPQPRKNVPDPHTEIRYFYPEDKQRAERIRQWLEKAGMSAAKVVFLPDKTAPKKFIQISLSKTH